MFVERGQGVRWRVSPDRRKGGRIIAGMDKWLGGAINEVAISLFQEVHILYLP